MGQVSVETELHSTFDRLAEIGKLKGSSIVNLAKQ